MQISSSLAKAGGLEQDHLVRDSTDVPRHAKNWSRDEYVTSPIPETARRPVRTVRKRSAWTTLLWMNLICVLPITLVLFSVAPVKSWERLARITMLVAVVGNCNFVLLTAFSRLVWSRIRFRAHRFLYIVLSVIVLPLVAAISAVISQVIFTALGWTAVPTFFELLQINLPLAVVYGLSYFLMGDYRHRLAAVSSDLRDSRRSAVALERERDELKLFALQVFLKPHFLFNALNSIAALIHEDSTKAEHALMVLARVLRRIVETRDVSLIPLGTEMAIVNDYLNLERIRLGDKLSVTVNVPDEILDIPVPAMVVQPIVENAIQHGIRQRPDGGHIGIRASVHGNECRIDVTDDGPGVSSHHGTGAARRLLQDRLDALYGRDHYEMTLMRDDVRGETIASLCLPLRPGTQAS